MPSLNFNSKSSSTQILNNDRQQVNELVPHILIQDKLRKEIVKEFPDKNFIPTFEQIHSLEYLNAVCKEILRVVPPGMKKKNFFFPSQQ